MATISAPDLALLRKQQHTTEFRFSVFTPSTLWTGRVNNGAIARGARSIAFDGASGSTTYIRSYQELWVGTGAGLYDVGRVRIKSFAGIIAGTITVDENAIVWQDDLYLTIKHFYPIERIPPRIASGVFYKFYNLPYSDQNTEPPPVCIAGPDRIAEITGATVTLDFDLSDSYAVANGATIASYTLEAEPTTGATVTFNTGTGVGDIEFSTSGEWWVVGSCTDSNGKTQERFIAVKIEDMSTGGSYLQVQVGNVRETWGSGATATVEAYGDVALSDFPDRAICWLWYRGEFDGVEDYVSILGADSQNILMTGYIRGSERITDNINNGTHGASFTIQTPDGFLGNLPMRSIGLVANSAPSAWWHYASWLTTGRAIHHLFKWHSTLLERHDFIGLTDNSQRDIKVEWPEGTMFQMANSIVWDTGILARVTCDRAGRVHMAADSQMLNTAGRAALDTVMEITDNDSGGEDTIVRQTEQQSFTCQVSGFYYPSIGQNTPYVSLIPGYREGGVSYGLPAQFGSSSTDKPNQLLVSQADSNEKCGRVFAHANREIVEIRIPFKGNYTGALSVIASVGWYEYGLTADNRKDLDGVLMLCRTIETQINQDAGAIVTSAVFEPEAQGPDGIQGNYPSSMPTPPPPPEPRWEIDAGIIAYVAFSSIFYREQSSSDWDTIDDEYDHAGGDIDPWWKQKQLSSNPKNAIIGGNGDNGLATKTIDSDGETINIAPAVSPPNTWTDGAPATFETVDYIQTLYSAWTQDFEFRLCQWQNTGDEWRGWLAYSTTGGNTWTWVELYDDVTLPDEIKPIWMAVNGSYLLVSVWVTGTGGGNDQFRLLVFDVSDMSYVDEFEMGDCTESERDARTFYAFPVTVYDDDTLWYIAGRMKEPQSLNDPDHIIYTDDSGSTFTSLEHGWGGDICSGLDVGLDVGGDREFYAARETS